MAATVRLVWCACPHFAGLEPPSYASAGSAGLDLRAACPEDAPIVLRPNERRRVPTGLCLSIPTGFEGQIRSRSGLALRQGLVCLNAPGTVDSDYRGEVQVLLANLGAETVRINRGDRIAQLVIAPVVSAILESAAELPETGRGRGGFGSTGVR